MQVQAELKRKVGRWRMATETVCCGQWLAVLDPREDNFSIATVPQRNGSFVSASQPVPDCSLSPGSARILRRQQPPTSPQPHASLQHFPSELEKAMWIRMRLDWTSHRECRCPSSFILKTLWSYSHMLWIQIQTEYSLAFIVHFIFGE